jgi:uncharacterized protein (DUF433 family)
MTVFKNTRLPVAHVGKMARADVPLEQIIEDYPYLSVDDVMMAMDFVGPRQ